MSAFFSWFTATMLWVFVLMAHVGNPSNADITGACQDHGQVVSYVAGGVFDFMTGHTAVCADGLVVTVK